MEMARDSDRKENLFCKGRMTLRRDPHRQSTSENGRMTTSQVVVSRELEPNWPFDSFEQGEEASQAAEEVNGKWVWDHQLMVKRARFLRNRDYDQGAT
ncbi:hypothetical protein RHMOL_Rhmol02G0243300 [Rhododendron molle]|uniref:Uncharacterized protein n=1 Tax=Rhododendron molle TaxID=49168 RepID=A0ACC0PV08_RHOML|nr:hypothetical protein RHMOL_Rhmol02G0243300 [Rhododendron molle]